MKKLTVIYDSSIEDKNRDIYLNKIKERFYNLDIIDISDTESEKQIDDKSKVIALKPLKEEDKEGIKLLFETFPDMDIEKEYTGGLTITAQAISETMGNVKGKTVVIINQSDTVGIPLATELLKEGAYVCSLGRHPNIKDLLSTIKPDWIVTATGDDSFQLGNELAGENVIDLSNDFPNLETAIRSVPTLKVLVRRMKEKD